MNQIKTLEDLAAAALNKQSVVVPTQTCWSRPRPAAFMQNQIGHVLLALFRAGMFVYEKPEKKKRSFMGKGEA